MSGGCLQCINPQRTGVESEGRGAPALFNILVQRTKPASGAGLDLYRNNPPLVGNDKIHLRLGLILLPYPEYRRLQASGASGHKLLADYLLGNPPPIQIVQISHVQKWRLKTRTVVHEPHIEEEQSGRAFSVGQEWQFVSGDGIKEMKKHGPFKRAERFTHLS